MPFGIAAILGGAGIAGSLITGNAATSAAQTQANAANNAANIQGQEYLNTQNNLRPFLQLGGADLENLQNMLGVGYNLQTGAQSFTPNYGILQNPQTALGPAPTYNMPAYTAQMYQQSPGYNALLQGQTQALQNAGATTTGALSGNVLQALQGAGTQLANQDYQQNYQNYATNYGNQFNANNANYWNNLQQANNQNSNAFNWLSQLAGSGQNAGASLGALGGQAAGNIGNAFIGAGNAQAAGTIGAANAYTGGINSLATLGVLPSSITSNSLLGQLLGGIYNSPSSTAMATAQATSPFGA
jgi:hypothetical protein